MSDIEPGPDLDALVATKVMGWHWDDAWGCLIPPTQKAKPSEMWTGWEMGEEGELVRKPIRENWVGGVSYSGSASKINLPNWSTERGSALEIVDYVLQNWRWPEWEPAFSLDCFLIDESQEPWWEAHFGLERADYAEDWLSWGEAETAALAICIGALYLVGGIKDDE